MCDKEGYEVSWDTGKETSETDGVFVKILVQNMVETQDLSSVWKLIDILSSLHFETQDKNICKLSPQFILLNLEKPFWIFPIKEHSLFFFFFFGMIHIVCIISIQSP